MLRLYATVMFTFWAGLAQACYIPNNLNDRAVLIEQYGRGAGSGVWLENDIILTANHVVKNLERIWVRLPFDLLTRYEVQLIHGTDDPDLAVLKLLKPPQPMTSLSLAQVQPHEPVMLISYAYGDASRLSRIKGKFLRNVKVNTQTSSVVHQFEMEEWTVGGDSGGAVYNCDAELVGVEFGNQAPIGENELMFAVSAAHIRQALDNLVEYRP